MKFWERRIGKSNRFCCIYLTTVLTVSTLIICCYILSSKFFRYVEAPYLSRSSPSESFRWLFYFRNSNFEEKIANYTAVAYNLVFYRLSSCFALHSIFIIACPFEFEFV